MAKTKALEFEQGDEPDAELTALFLETADSFKISPGRLLGRAMFLASQELHGTNALAYEIDTRVKNGAQINYSLIVDKETWYGRSPWVQGLGESRNPNYQYDPDWEPK